MIKNYDWEKFDEFFDRMQDYLNHPDAANHINCEYKGIELTIYHDSYVKDLMTIFLLKSKIQEDKFWYE